MRAIAPPPRRTLAWAARLGPLAEQRLVGLAQCASANDGTNGGGVRRGPVGVRGKGTGPWGMKCSRVRRKHCAGQQVTERGVDVDSATVTCAPPERQLASHRNGIFALNNDQTWVGISSDRLPNPVFRPAANLVTV